MRCQTHFAVEPIDPHVIHAVAVKDNELVRRSMIFQPLMDARADMQVTIRDLQWGYHRHHRASRKSEQKGANRGRSSSRRPCL
jgi:hypothetical protein